MSFAQVKVPHYKEVLHPPLADLGEKREKAVLKKDDGRKRVISFSPKQKLKVIIKARHQEKLMIYSFYGIGIIIFVVSLI